MHGLTGDPPTRAGSFMPPATTRRFAERPASSEDARIVPPFVPSDVAPRRELPSSEAEPAAAFGAELEMAQPEPAQPEPTFIAAEQEAEVSAPEVVEVTPAEAAADAVEARAVDAEASPAEAEPIELSWESLVVEEEIEPTFAADTDAVLTQLSDYAAELSQRDEFPLEAFGEQEPTQQHRTEPDTQPADEPVLSPASSLAERLEKLSHRLRVEQSEEIVRRLAAGDRLDTLLAGLLAGYLAGKSEQ